LFEKKPDFRINVLRENSKEIFLKEEENRFTKGVRRF
jgi:hypothetical protein